MTAPRRPRFAPIILTGAVLGFALGSGAALFDWFAPDTVSPARGDYSGTSAVGYLGFLGAGIFALLAALVALALDRRSDRRL
ncbi:MAG: hypothetical protein ACRCSN_15885 [Dermatophilaceae bacterium]